MESYDVIPNIIHFIVGIEKDDYPFLFISYLSILSSYLINKPNKIYIWYNHLPNGKWWDKTLKIKNTELKKIKVQKKFNNKEILDINHKKDFLKINILYNYGGIYLNLNTISLRSYRSILTDSTVMIRKNENEVYSNFIGSPLKSNFFKLWIQEYLEKFSSFETNKCSEKIPLELLMKHNSKLELLSEVYNKSNNNNDVFSKKITIPPQTLFLSLENCDKKLKSIGDIEWANKNKNTLLGKIILKLIKYNV